MMVAGRVTPPETFGFTGTPRCPLDGDPYNYFWGRAIYSQATLCNVIERANALVPPTPI